MNSKCVKTGLFQTNCYVVQDNDFCAVIDPGDDLDNILALVEKPVTHILLTHAHFDHVGALEALHGKYPSAIIAAGEHEPMDTQTVEKEARYVLGSTYFMAGFARDGFSLPKPDILLKDGDTIGPFTVLFTPGHSFGSVCYYNPADKVLFSGDTLFRHNYGRTDINGDHDMIIESVRRLLSMDKDIQVYPGHDSPTTIGSEQVFFSSLL